MANMVIGIVSLSIGIVVLANVFISTVKNTNQTVTCVNNASAQCDWTAAEVSLWGLLTIVGIAGIAYGVMSVFNLA